MVTTIPCRASALALCVLLWAMGCEKPEPPAPARPQFVQSDYAKNPDGPCEKHPAEFYADKAKTKAGIEELIILSCQYGVRGDYHGREAMQSAGVDQRKAHLDTHIACLSEKLNALKALEKAGVTSTECPKT